jgi:glutamyl-tRNA synthetase
VRFPDAATNGGVVTSTREHYAGRLAPAPTGALHIGNARTFLVAWLRARAAGGRLILRLEDLDHPKVKPGAAREAYEDLAWLGLDWDAGPAESFPAAAPPADAGERYAQSKNLSRYEAALRRLDAAGKTYPCACSRRDIERLQSAPNAFEDIRERAYPGTCRERFASVGEARLGLDGREPAIRYRIDADDTAFVDGFLGPRGGGLAEWSGDFVIARGDRVSYQLAVVVDDHEMGVTEVVRGEDLAPSAERQIALYRALGYPVPRFFHVPLVVGPDGRRLAKRHGDSRISILRRRGEGPGRLLGWLAWTLGWNDRPVPLTIHEIADRADFSAIPASPAVFDREALVWLGL